MERRATRRRIPAYVITRYYERAHGKTPRGWGWWIFQVEGDTPQGTETVVMTLTGRYAEARQRAIDDARSRWPNANAIYLYPQP